MPNWNICQKKDELTGKVCGSYLVGLPSLACKNSKNRKIAGFDLDQTLITPKSLKKFPRNSDDWMWNYQNVKDVLQKLQQDGFEIIIVTNQAGIGQSDSKLEEFKKKIENMEKDIRQTNPSLEFQIYCMNNKDIYRKPFPTIFENMSIDHDLSFYCGDGAGRPKDHTDSDIKFAHNARLHFKTPECVFLNELDEKGIVRYPELKSSEKPYHYVPNVRGLPELIIMVGFPASGKSHISRSIVEMGIMQHNRIIRMINQDTIGTKQRMVRMIKEYIDKNETVLVDNTNLDPTTRNELIGMIGGMNYYVRIIHVNTPLERCIHNNYYRYYVSGGVAKLVPDFVYKMMVSKFKQPTKTENNLIELIEVVCGGVPSDYRYFYYY
jgi:bifunctional polynucleotide phosphatase/kinase